MGLASFNFAVFLLGTLAAGQAPQTWQGSLAPVQPVGQAYSYSWRSPAYIPAATQTKSLSKTKKTTVLRTPTPFFEIPYAPGVREAMLSKNKPVYEVKSSFVTSGQPNRNNAAQKKKVVKVVRKGTNSGAVKNTSSKTTAKKVVKQKKTSVHQKDNRYRQFAVKNKGTFKKTSVKGECDFFLLSCTKFHQFTLRKYLPKIFDILIFFVSSSPKRLFY